MKTKLTKYLSLGAAIIGFIHIIATFTPVIAGKMPVLDEKGQQAFIYMSLMCGTLLLLGGTLTYILADKIEGHAFLKRPFNLILFVMALDGILAAYFMPDNPCSWVVLCLTLPLIIIQFMKQQ